MEQGGCIATEGPDLGSCWAERLRLSATTGFMTHLNALARVSNPSELMGKFWFFTLWVCCKIRDTFVEIVLRRLVERRRSSAARSF